jgi:hypothetical protein
VTKKPSCAIGASGRFMRCLPLSIIGCGRNRLGFIASHSFTGDPPSSQSRLNADTPAVALFRKKTGKLKAA